MLSFVGVCIIVAVCCHSCLCDTEEQHRTQFEEFKRTYNKEYTSLEDDEYRFTVFVENLKKASERQKRETGTAKFGVTKFSDITVEEFRGPNLGLNLQQKDDDPLAMAEIPNIEIPENFDWRKKNVVTPVKDQGLCGSCWAFSTTGNIESLWAIRKKKLISLSEQELNDCNKFNFSCNSGGDMYKAMETIISLGGLESENSYPYVAQDTKCAFNKSKVAVSISGRVKISKNEGDMAKWLVENNPISIAIDASDMQFYQKGISQPSAADCNPVSLNHGVLIVGYGVEEKIPYWIMKNSWGSDWGEKGYYRIVRGKGSCGLNTQALSAVLKS